jgi:hypothetical protein
VATKKQKEQLIELLKFTPTKVTMYISGYGGEAYAGTVDRKIYDYFKEHKIDISDYASDWDNNYNVPDDLQPFPAGSPYECDNIFHESGAELSSINTIAVYDDKNEIIWECAAGYSELDDQGVECVNFFEESLSDYTADGKIVFWGGNGEKGTFFEGEIELRAPFDPKKLKITYTDCDGWELIGLVEYDGEEIDGSYGYSTSGKWTENKWVLPEGVEDYEPEEVDEDDEEDTGDSVLDFTQEVERIKAELDAIEIPVELDWSALPDEPEVTDWFESDVKPVRKGTYEAVIDAPWPLSGVRMVEWSGRGWKEDGKKVLIKQWRGLAENPEA